MDNAPEGLRYDKEKLKKLKSNAQMSRPPDDQSRSLCRVQENGEQLTSFKGIAGFTLTRFSGRIQLISTNTRWLLTNARS